MVVKRKFSVVRGEFHKLIMYNIKSDCSMLKLVGDEVSLYLFERLSYPEVGGNITVISRESIAFVPS